MIKKHKTDKRMSSLNNRMLCSSRLANDASLLFFLRILRRTFGCDRLPGEHRCGIGRRHLSHLNLFIELFLQFLLRGVLLVDSAIVVGIIKTLRHRGLQEGIFQPLVGHALIPIFLVLGSTVAQGQEVRDHVMTFLEIKIKEDGNYDERHHQGSRDDSALEEKDGTENDLGEDHARDGNSGKIEPQFSAAIICDWVHIDKLVAEAHGNQKENSERKVGGDGAHASIYVQDHH
mmetsp:Transcript_6697/g.11179  ORF Transcript_6697/g.11179 Transcript_6697/m.11179 type:complete len:232 (-) Transcript_6697:20-715(-)